MTNNEILSYIKKSFELKQQGFYKPAIEMLYKALALDCDNIEILLQLAYIYKLLKNSERAIYYIEKVLDINAKHIESLFLLEEIYYEQEHFASALYISEKIYNIEPNCKNLAKKLNILNQLNDLESVKIIETSDLEKNDEVLYEMAKAYSNYDLSHSIELLEKGYEKNYLNLDITLLLAKHYYENNNLEKSKKLFEKLEKASPNAETFNYLGLFNLNENDYDDAVEHFTKACNNDSQNAEYAYNLASAFFLKNSPNEALKFFNKAICIEPNNINYHYSIAYLYYQTKFYDKALLELDFIRKIDPTHNLSNILNAMILAKKGDLLTAKFEIENIIKLKNYDDFAYYALSQIYKELSQINLAKNNIEKALELNPNSLEYLSELEDIEFILENYEKVIEISDKIVNLNEKYVSAYIYKAKVYLLNEDFDELYETAQRIIDCDLNVFEGYYYNALALFNQGDKDFAIESLKKAISLNLNNAELYTIMSSFYQETGDFKQAYDWAKEASEIDNKNYKYKWLCANLALTLKNNEEAGKFFTQSYRLASSDKDLCNDYAKFLKSIGKDKQAKYVLSN